jgi:hypothetical protein
LGAVQQNYPSASKDFSQAIGQTPSKFNKRKHTGLLNTINHRKNPRGILRDYEEEDFGSGTEADNEETEEDGNYDSEYELEDEDRENRFFDNDEDEGPMDIDINPKLQQQVERPSSRADSEN